MDLQAFINSPGMWIASSVMVILILIQSFFFMREAFRAAAQMDIPRQDCIKGMRSAMITAIGPSLGPIVIMLALITILGAPTTWMRMNDIGAARTELAMATLASNVSGIELRSPQFGPNSFSYVMWGLALNNLGWMAISLLLVNRMDRTIRLISEKSNPKWIKLAMAGAMFGLFAFLWSGTLLKGSANLFAGLVAFSAMYLISFVSNKYPRLQEPALGLAMIIGMLAGAIVA
jgi:hypothetical protein